MTCTSVAHTREPEAGGPCLFTHTCLSQHTHTHDFRQQHRTRGAARAAARGVARIGSARHCIRRCGGGNLQTKNSTAKSLGITMMIKEQWPLGKPKQCIVDSPQLRHIALCSSPLRAAPLWSHCLRLPLSPLSRTPPPRDHKTPRAKNMSMRISMLILVTNTKSSSPTHTYTPSTGHPQGRCCRCCILCPASLAMPLPTVLPVIAALVKQRLPKTRATQHV